MHLIGKYNSAASDDKGLKRVVEVITGRSANNAGQTARIGPKGFAFRYNSAS